MKILITGNMGYLGPCVVRRLRISEPDAILIGVDTAYFGTCLTQAGVLPESRIDVQYFMDIRKFSGEILEGVDAVVHLAAISNDPMGNSFEDITFDINYRASVMLAKMAKSYGVKSFIYASSCSVYGCADEGARSESDAVQPLTAYAKSKVLTEQELRRLADKEFTVTCLRFSTACGMSDRLRLDLVLNDFVADAVTGKHISILSDGTPWRPLINVKDMARAIDWAVNRSSSDGGTFLAVNIGSEQWNYQVKDLAEAVAEIIPSTDISINKDAPPDKRSYRVSFDLFKQLAPKYQPEFNLTDSILELKSGIAHMNFNGNHFRDSDFIRLKMISRHRKSGRLNEQLYWT